MFLTITDTLQIPVFLKDSTSGSATSVDVEAKHLKHSPIPVTKSVKPTVSKDATAVSDTGKTFNTSVHTAISETNASNPATKSPGHLQTPTAKRCDTCPQPLHLAIS